MDYLQLIDQAASAIRARSPMQPRVLVVLGTGLAGIGDRLQDVAVIPYADIPGFAEPSVGGHVGELVLGRLAGVPVAVMKGKIFSFEEAGINGMRVPVLALRRLGAQLLFYSASVGSMLPQAGVGELVLITDHINAMGTSPLLGDDAHRFGDRFVDLAEAYDGPLNDRLRAVAAAQRIALHEGIYGAMRGPAFETPAEVRMLVRLGADVVGMSLVPEVLLARQCGMKVVAIANVTNVAVGMTTQPINHAQTLVGAKSAEGKLEILLKQFLDGLYGA